MKFSVLVVDDDVLVNELMEETIRRTGHECKAVFSGEEAVAAFNDRSYDIVLTDLKMKGMDGIDVLKYVKKVSPESAVVIMTAYGTIDTAVKAIKSGAYDFLIKPILPETVAHVMDRITEVLSLRSENETLRQDLEHKFQNIIGKSQTMRQVFDLIKSVASARSTIMITGDSGTGKEMVSQLS